ncbi:MAG: hypothetical protein RIT81_33475 [Deltaproteobacteria bacterium]
MKRTLAFAALSTFGLPAAALADVAPLRAPPVCLGTQVRHRVMLPTEGARNIPLNASIWAIEDTRNGDVPLELVDTVTDEAIALDPVYYPTATGVVVQFKPTEDLQPSRVYTVRNTHRPDYQFTAGRDRDEVAPRAPTMLDGFGRYFACGETYGLAVFLDAEADTLTFAERADGTLLGYSEPFDALQVAGEVETEVEFVAYSVDLAGNASEDTDTRRQKIEETKSSTILPFGCTCADSGRAGLWAGLLLLPLALLARRR